jgi:hypothetical protein
MFFHIQNFLASAVLGDQCRGSPIVHCAARGGKLHEQAFAGLATGIGQGKALALKFD